MNASYQTTIKYFSTGISCTFHIILLIILFANFTRQFFSPPAPPKVESPPQAKEPASIIFQDEEQPNNNYTPPAEPVFTAPEIAQEIPEKFSTQPSIKPEIRRSKWRKNTQELSRPNTEQEPEQTSIGNQLNQNFSRYLQKQYSASAHQNTNTAPTYAEDFTHDIYLKKLYKAVVDAAKTYSKSVHSDQDIYTKIQATLEIDASGKLTNIQLSKSTGNLDIDNSMKELCYASRFPPLPASLKKELLHYPIIFNLRQKKGFATIVFTPESVF